MSKVLPIADDPFKAQLGHNVPGRFHQAVSEKQRYILTKNIA